MQKNEQDEYFKGYSFGLTLPEHSCTFLELSARLGLALQWIMHFRSLRSTLIQHRALLLLFLLRWLLSLPLSRGELPLSFSL